MQPAMPGCLHSTDEEVSEYEELGVIARYAGLSSFNSIKNSVIM